MAFDLIQKRSAELSELDSLLDNQEAKIRNAFLDFVNRIGSDEVIKEMVKYLKAGDIQGALSLIDYAGTTLGTAANVVFLGSAAKEASKFVDQFRRLSGNPVGLNQFDSTFAAIANQTGVDFIRETTQSQKNAVLRALEQGYGQDVRKVARLIKSSIGLTESQLDAVDSYRSLLQRGSKQALERALRDKRYDSSVAKAEDSPLNPDQIDRMVEAYRRKYVSYRATVIARTEGGAISGLARETGLRQMLRQANISESRIDKTWRTRRDDKVRNPLHQEMEGVTVPLNSVYTMTNGETCMRPHDPNLSAKQRCSCRCNQIFRLRQNMGL